MKRFTLMVSFLTLLCLNIVAQNFELYENKQIFSNMFTEEEYRTSTSVAPLCTSELSWNVAKRVYSSGYTLKNQQTTSPLYLLVVEDKLYPYIRSNIYDYAQIVSAKTGYDIEVVTVNSRGSAMELRKRLSDLRPRLIGCFFIGDVPYAQYQIENEDNSGVNTTFPCDLYFMDLDGTWLDYCSNPGSEGRFTLGADGIFDWHVGSVAPDIFIGRLPYYYSLDNRPFEQLVNQYLERLIRYWEQPDGIKRKALSYINHDWATSYEHARQNVSRLSPLENAGFTIDAYNEANNPRNISAGDYLSKITSGQYSFVHLWAHSHWTYHMFGQEDINESYLFQSEIYASPIKALMYNLFCCSATRWTEKSYLGGAYLFGPKSNTLALVGSTKVGSMYDSAPFHGLLAYGLSIGESYFTWWDMRPHLMRTNSHSDEDISWYYGLTILGDPLVRLGNPIDLYMQDAPDDDGSMPNAMDDMKYNFWESQDIWIRNQRDGGTEHQNPVYREGKPVFVYARIRNRGAKTSPQGATVTLRWSQAGISLDYDSFCGKNKLDNGVATGGLIGTKGIPSVRPNESVVICFPWYIKDPKQYQQYTKDAWHYCLLAEIESIQEPISEKMHNLRDYVKSYNNVAMKNIYNIEVSDDDNSLISGVISIHNPSIDNRIYKIELETFDKNTLQQTNLCTKAEVSLIPDRMLYHSMVGNKAELRNLQLLKSEGRLVAQTDLASMDKVCLAPGEMGLLNVKFNFKEQMADLDGEYICRVLLKDQETGELVGGETYVIKKKSRPKFNVVIGHKLEEGAVHLVAQQISEPATYRWRDSEGELLSEGLEFTTKTSAPVQLEVEAKSDGVKGKALFEGGSSSLAGLLTISPNPAKDYLDVKVKMESEASLIITSVADGCSYIYPILKEGRIDVGSLPRGKYLVSLFCKEEMYDKQTIILE
jgi:hypothetical protein